MIEFRNALRRLRPSPGFSLVAILTLALAIGANSSIFSAVNALLLRQLHYQNPDRLVWVQATRQGVSRAFFSVLNFTDTREQSQTLDHWIAFTTWGVNLRGGEETERVQGIRISAEAFQNLGLRAAAGRTLGPNDENSDAAAVVMLGYNLWQRRFGGDPGVVGRQVRIDRNPYTVVGVVPRDLVIPNAEMEWWHRSNSRAIRAARIAGRISPPHGALETGVTPPRRTRIGRDYRPVAPTISEDNGNLTTPRVVPLQDEVVGSYRQSLLCCSARSGCAPIACAEPANLQIARAAARREGNGDSHRARRERLASSATTPGRRNGLAFLGGTLGLILATWGKDLLVALSPGDFPLAQTITIDGRVLAFCAGVSLLAGCGPESRPGAPCRPERSQPRTQDGRPDR
jgi:putative ABC transport system permease protein